MTDRDAKTIASTVRIYNWQRDELNKAFKKVPMSALVRALLSLFYADKIPEAYPLALEEMAKGEQSLKTHITPRVSVAQVKKGE
jgi:hypothetical protein